MSSMAIAAPVNPRYLAYCLSQGEHDPDAMLKRDEEAYPGGKMAGFMLFISESWMGWRALTGYRGFLGQDQYDAFDAWLQDRVWRDALAAVDVTFPEPGDGT